MKQRKKLKTKQNIIIQNESEEDITPQYHEKLGNVNLFSEEVVKNIVELCISLTITTEFRKNIDAKINDFCASSFISKTNNVIELYNLNYDKDDFNGADYSFSKTKYLKTDMDEKRNKLKIHQRVKNKRNIFGDKVIYNKSNDNKNKKSEMIIKNKEIEDLLNKSTQDINKINLMKKVNIQYDIEIDRYKWNYWGDVIQPKTSIIDRTSSLYNNLKTDKNIKNIFKKININEKKTHKRIPTYKKNYALNYKEKLSALNEEPDLRKKRVIPILEMPCVELPKEENKNKEPEELQKIRKETIEIMEAKKEKMKKLEKKFKLNDNKETVYGKYTTDVNGKIVLIKEIRPEDLLKDFYPLRYKQKELLAGIPLKELRKENALLEQKAEKNIIFNNSHSRNSLNSNQFFSINKESDKEFKFDNNLSMRPFGEEGTYDFPFHNQVKEQVILGGSNIDLMDPSPGVNIKAKHLTKSGTINFFKTYHRYSLDEFDKVLKDALENEKAKYSGNYMTNNLTHLKKDTLQKNEKSDLNKNLNINKLKVRRNKNNFRKTFSEGFRQKKILQKQVREEYTLNRKNSYELKKIFMNDDGDIDNEQKKKKIEKIKSFNNILNRNILTPSGRIANKKREINLSLMDNFNKEILTGYLNYDKRENVLPILPQRRIKLDKIANNLNINNMSRTTKNFYRTRQKRHNDLLQSLSTNTVRKKNNNKI